MFLEQPQASTSLGAAQDVRARILDARGERVAAGAIQEIGASSLGRRIEDPQSTVAVADRRRVLARRHGRVARRQRARSRKCGRDLRASESAEIAQEWQVELVWSSSTRSGSRRVDADRGAASPKARGADACLAVAERRLRRGRRRPGSARRADACRPSLRLLAAPRARRARGDTPRPRSSSSALGRSGSASARPRTCARRTSSSRQRARGLMRSSRGPADGHDTAPDRHPRASHRLRACTTRTCDARLGRDRPRRRANFASSL